jgi:hypothetical protein
MEEETMNSVVALKEEQEQDMTRLELLTLLLSIKALIESGNIEKAMEIINEVIEEARKS